MSRSLSGSGAVSVLPAPGDLGRTHDGVRPEHAPGRGRTRLVGFFPGLGSRAAYRDLGRSLLDCGIPEVQRIYHDAARVLGCPGRLDQVLLVPENLPRGRIAQQGFVGAGFLVHSLALEAYLRVAAERRGVPLDFAAYTGESFGIITSAVAAGSLSVSDGVAIGYAFTPLMLVAAEGEDREDPVARDAARYLPPSVRRSGLVPEPFHVVGLRADPDHLAEALHALSARFPAAEVEVHKHYSWRQRNLYVSASAKSAFDTFMRGFRAVEATELKDPTRFLAHSARMGEARRALERFMHARGVVFRPPRVPVVANDGAGLLTTADQVRDAVLAVTDRLMASESTVRTVQTLRPDVVVELGLGGRSVRLLTDNLLDATTTAYAAGATETDLFLRAVTLVDAVRGQLDALRRPGHDLEAHHFQLLRSVFRLAEQSPFADSYLRRTARRVIAEAMLPPAPAATPAFHRFLEVFQHTYNHRHSVSAGDGELVLRARLKKRVCGPAERLDQAYAELSVIGKAGESADRSSIHVEQPEVLVFHFDRLADLDRPELARRLRAVRTAQPAVRRVLDDVPATLQRGPAGRIVYQCALLRVLRVRRPALFAQSDHYLEGADPLGWSAALAAAGALPLRDAAQAYGQYASPQRRGAPAGDRAAGARRAVDRITAALTDAAIPVISPAGVPLQSRKDLAAATRAVFCEGALDAAVRPIRLNGDCQVICLGSPLDPAQVDAGPFRTDIIRVDDPAATWTRQVTAALDDFEERATLALTRENERVLRHARSRRILASTVNAYVDAGEPILGFGKGGSESMTIFLGRDGTGTTAGGGRAPGSAPTTAAGPTVPAGPADHGTAGDDGKQHIVVRKVLSEALIAARWDPQGQGVMLPPFVKARKQAEFLQALPEPVRRYFPAVHTVVERRVPVPPHRRRGGQAGHREVLYEMDYVHGQEVSRFVEDHRPPPVVVARLYEQILRLLHRRVHSVARRPAPGDTLEVSYFRKIEDRLGLCRRTAPRTFAPALLDTERIVVDSVPYRNIPALLARFRARPEYGRVLEPRQHCLVMGDANTENIKLADTGPLLHAQRLIEAGCPQHEIDAALAALTPESVGITFLDPRAIGFGGDGRDTRDDPMYDNKPWHNSVGHYDEIHYEQFALRLRTGDGLVPAVDVEFTAGNPYQRAYRVRDVTAAGGRVTPHAPRGIEDWFAPVMTSVYGLDDPHSPYLADDPYWIVRFVFVMGTHFAAMPPFHFQAERDGTLSDSHQAQRRPVALYCQGVKWLNWAWEMLEGTRQEFLGIPVPPLPWQ
jgi:hypothetical protein